MRDTYATAKQQNTILKQALRKQNTHRQALQDDLCNRIQQEEALTAERDTYKLKYETVHQQQPPDDDRETQQQPRTTAGSTTGRFGWSTLLGAGVSKEDLDKLRCDVQILKDELELKIIENETLHMTEFELKKNHEKETAKLTEDLRRLQLLQHTLKEDSANHHRHLTDIQTTLQASQKENQSSILRANKLQTTVSDLKASWQASDKEWESRARNLQKHVLLDDHSVAYWTTLNLCRGGLHRYMLRSRLFRSSACRHVRDLANSWAHVLERWHACLVAAKPHSQTDTTSSLWEEYTLPRVDSGGILNDVEIQQNIARAEMARDMEIKTNSIIRKSATHAQRAIRLCRFIARAATEESWRNEVVRRDHDGTREMRHAAQQDEEGIDDGDETFQISTDGNQNWGLLVDKLAQHHKRFFAMQILLVSLDNYVHPGYERESTPTFIASMKALWKALVALAAYTILLGSPHSCFTSSVTPDLSSTHFTTTANLTRLALAQQHLMDSPTSATSTTYPESSPCASPSLASSPRSPSGAAARGPIVSNSTELLRAGDGARMQDLREWLVRESRKSPYWLCWQDEERLVNEQDDCWITRNVRFTDEAKRKYILQRINDALLRLRECWETIGRCLSERVSSQHMTGSHSRPLAGGGVELVCLLEAVGKHAAAIKQSQPVLSDWVQQMLLTPYLGFLGTPVMSQHLQRVKAAMEDECKRLEDCPHHISPLEAAAIRTKFESSVAECQTLKQNIVQMTDDVEVYKKLKQKLEANYAKLNDEYSELQTDADVLRENCAALENSSQNKSASQSDLQEVERDIKDDVPARAAFWEGLQDDPELGKALTVQEREEKLRDAYIMHLDLLKHQLEAAEKHSGDVSSDLMGCLQHLREGEEHRMRLQESLDQSLLRTVAFTEDLKMTKTSYDSQLAVLTEHICELSEKLTEKDGKLAILQAHKVLCGRCGVWNTIGHLVSDEGLGGCSVCGGSIMT